MSLRAPTVSIVLPTYSRAAMLESAVASCLAQDYSDLELIVVDDASPDATPAVLSRLAAADPRVVVIRHESNLGQVPAMRHGFERARGRFLTWTSDDNLYRPTAIGRMLRELEASPAVAYVYADYSEIDAEGRTTRACSVDPPEELIHHNAVGPCFLYRREVYEAIGDYAEDLPLVQDLDFCLRVYTRFRMAPIHEDLYEYRVHPGAGSEMHAWDQFLQGLEVFRRNLPGLRALGRAPAARAHLTLSTCGFEMSRPWVGRRHWLAAAMLAPQLALGQRALLAQVLMGTRLALVLQRALGRASNEGLAKGTSDQMPTTSR